MHLRPIADIALATLPLTGCAALGGANSTPDQLVRDAAELVGADAVGRVELEGSDVLLYYLDGDTPTIARVRGDSVESQVEDTSADWLRPDMPPVDEFPLDALVERLDTADCSASRMAQVQLTFSGEFTTAIGCSRSDPFMDVQATWVGDTELSTIETWDAASLETAFALTEQLLGDEVREIRFSTPEAITVSAQYEFTATGETMTVAGFGECMPSYRVAGVPDDTGALLGVASCNDQAPFGDAAFSLAEIDTDAAIEALATVAPTAGLLYLYEREGELVIQGMTAGTSTMWSRPVADIIG